MSFIAPFALVCTHAKFTSINLAEPLCTISPQAVASHHLLQWSASKTDTIREVKFVLHKKVFFIQGFLNATFWDLH